MHGARATALILRQQLQVERGCYPWKVLWSFGICLTSISGRIEANGAPCGLGHRQSDRVMQFCRISDCQRGRAGRIFRLLGSMVEIYSNLVATASSQLQGTYKNAQWVMNN